MIHFEKVSWSVSKTYIIVRHLHDLTKKILSGFDTASLHGISLYVCGVIGETSIKERFDIRYGLDVSLLRSTLTSWLLRLNKLSPFYIEHERDI
jgi:hypothetical protein